MLFLSVFIVDFEYSLFIVNVIKCYLMTYLCGKPNRRYIYGSCIYGSSFLIFIVSLQFPLPELSQCH